MENNQIIDHPDYYLLPCGKQLEDFIAYKCLSFAYGSALKYAWRAGKKFGESREKDLKKRTHYVKFISKFTTLSEQTVAARVDDLLAEAENWDGGAC